MALVVNTNVPSISSQRYLMESRSQMETAMERLSSGKRINSAADDAAGLTIATRMETQTRGLNMAIRNANDGISVVQSAEGAIQEVTEMLQRMRELAVQSSSGANSDLDRSALDAEVQQLKEEIDRISNTTMFNNVNLLDGSYNTSVQIGQAAGETLEFSIGAISTSALGIGNGQSSTGGSDVLVSGRVSLDTSTEINDGDIEINGVAIGGFNGTSAAVTGIDSTDNNIADFVDLVNKADAGATASAFNQVVASNVGTGIVAADQVAIQVGAVGTTPAQEAIIGASNSMAELVDNINLAMGGSVQASVDGDGRLVLSNQTGASISLADMSGTDTATDGGTGFTVETGAGVASGLGSVTYSANTFNGFVRLASTNGEDISVTRGNTGLTTPGSLDDLEAVGFREIQESPTGQPYTITGKALSAVTGAIGQGDLTLNGVEIFEQDLATVSDSFQGKLDLINAFQSETGVVASAYFEKSFDFSNTDFIEGLAFDLNGTQVSMGSTLDATVTNINAVTSTTGLTAEVNGKNVVLTGSNVQHVTIGNFDFDLDDDFEAEVAAMNSKTDTSNTDRTISFANLNFATGLQLSLNFRSGAAIQNAGGGTAGIFAVSAGTQTITYTVGANDGQREIAEGFRAALNQFVLDGNTRLDSAAAAGLSVGAFISVFSAANVTTLFLRDTMSIGSAVISFSVTLPTDGRKAFSAEASSFGAIRLTSQDDSAISIDLGSNAAVGEHGLLEMNVGAADYDHLDPAYGGASMVSGLTVLSADGAQSALSVLDQALDQISNQRASLGALENRLGHTVSNLANIVENTEASKSRIQDADFAQESAALARAQILQQAGTAMLAQANAAPQNVLSLLG